MWLADECTVIEIEHYEKEKKEEKKKRRKQKAKGKEKKRKYRTTPIVHERKCVEKYRHESRHKKEEEARRTNIAPFFRNFTAGAILWWQEGGKKRRRKKGSKETEGTGRQAQIQLTAVTIEAKNGKTARMAVRHSPGTELAKKMTAVGY